MKRIGMDKKVELEWLDRLAFGLRENRNYKELRSDLENYLSTVIHGDESRRKHINVLIRIWVSVLPEHESLRNQALKLLPELSARERVVLHWGLCLLAYDLFRDMASVIGRLFTINEEVALAQIHNRIIESWGDRTNLKYAVPRMLSTMANWKVLKVSGSRGFYAPADKIKLDDKDLKLWLLECYLTCIERKSVTVQSLTQEPAFFPFNLEIKLSDLINSDRYEVNRQGLDVDVVELRS